MATTKTSAGKAKSTTAARKPSVKKSTKAKTGAARPKTAAKSTKAKTGAKKPTAKVKKPAKSLKARASKTATVRKTKAR